VTRTPRTLHLLDPEPSAAWAPFAGIRPLSELRVGAALVRESWEAFAGAETTAIFALPHLAGFVEAGVPAVTPPRPVAGPALIGASAFAPRGPAPALPAGDLRLTHAGRSVGWVVAPGSTWTRPSDDGPAVEVAGLGLRGVFDLVPALERLLAADLAARLEDSDPIPRGSTVIGEPAWLALRQAAVEPGVVFDTAAGPIVLESGVAVKTGTRLEGPLWVGANTQLLGGPIRASAIGPHCKVRGEVSTCVFLGYANKAHDGFVGHSVIGRWVNLGAGTITSDLKNTYGPVRLEVAGTALETGLQFLGSLIGDHAKTAIGTLLGTGTVIGAGANVFDAVRPPKYVPPFAWGGSGRERMTREGFLRIAERVLRRRDVPVDEATRACFARLYDWATG
jgi:UDP-N-acetylglucosamine diphosphorylase/glucosamine-1-phosphate N-acetyltransferase